MKPINYTKIAMDNIHPEARRIAVKWMEGWEEWMKSDIRHKVKLASDIQNFAIAYHEHELSNSHKQVVSCKRPSVQELIIILHEISTHGSYKAWDDFMAAGATAKGEAQTEKASTPRLCSEGGGIVS